MKVDGTLDAKVNFNDKKATILFDDEKTNVSALIKATLEAGYPSTEAVKESGLWAGQQKWFLNLSWPAQNVSTRKKKLCQQTPAFGFMSVRTVNSCWNRYREIAAFTVPTEPYHAHPFNKIYVAAMANKPPESLSYSRGIK